jgi:hypothetical protein
MLCIVCHRHCYVSTWDTCCVSEKSALSAPVTTREETWTLGDHFVVNWRLLDVLLQCCLSDRDDSSGGVWNGTAVEQKYPNVTGLQCRPLICSHRM